LADYHRDFVYCSPYLAVVSIEGLPPEMQAVALGAVDDDDPETALIRDQDSSALNRWVDGLPEPLLAVAQGLLNGETKAAIARRLGISEPAITKRMKRIGASASLHLGGLRRSPLLC
jgi:DNA-directed RNA polymerase specialized sigma24 family protein